MPELPDVERFRRFLRRHAAGRGIRRVTVTDPGILRNSSARALDRALRGHRFEDPDRHGKWLIAWTTGPAALLHFGMDGGLGWGDSEEGRHRHDRAIFVLDRGELRYRNMRKLGGVWLAHGPPEVEAILGGLGPDALDVRRRHFLSLMRRRRGRVKAVLMDQRLVAGVGNLVADEALWRSRIHPAAPVERLDDGALDRLYSDLREVLREAIPGMGRGSRPWLVHRRGVPGAACPRCGTPLRRSTVGGRTTYACPRCQPEPQPAAAPSS